MDPHRIDLIANTINKFLIFTCIFYLSLTVHDNVSMRIPLFSAAKILLPASVNLNIASITDSSVDVVS